ncbi:hypothetical protein M407DRAFT_66549, partial [Tulasnella calospora MUT 4182]
SALFNFESLLLVLLLMICTCSYVRAVAPGLVDRNKEGQPSVLICFPAIFRFLGVFFKFARIGERLSPYVALACVIMAVRKIV